MVTEHIDPHQHGESHSAVESPVKRAVALYKSGEPALAQSICTDILRRTPEQPDALHLLGLMAYQQGDSEGAVDLLRRACDAGPEDLNIHKNFILILKTLGRMAAAAMHCEAALACRSNNHFIYQGLGDLYFNEGYFEAAANCYEQVLDINPDSIPILGNLGNALQGCGRYDEAIRCYGKALLSDPANPEHYYNMGVAFNQKEMAQDALENFEKALILDPDHTQALFNMGNALKQQGRLVTAIACYEKCIHLNPNDIDAYQNLANTLYASGNLNRALDVYAAALERDPDHTLVLNNLACLFRELGANDQAFQMIDRSIAIDPENGGTYVTLGNLHKGCNESDDAINAYKKALTLTPNNGEALMNIGRLLKQKGEYAAGMRYLKAAAEQSDEITNAWWYYYLSVPIIYDTVADIDRHRRRLSEGMETLIEKVKSDSPANSQKALEGIGSITNFHLSYQGRNDVELQKKYGRFVHRVMAANFPQWSQPISMPSRNKDEKIKIGYVSSFMRTHTVGFYLKGFLENHDPSQFEIYGYYIGNERDDETSYISENCHKFEHLPGDVAALAAIIRRDDLNILTFSDIGMYGPATQLAGLRLAPVQCCWWGHPVTTGLPTIDYFLSSELMETTGAAEHYAESLVLLPNMGLVVDRPETPDVKNEAREAFGLSESDFVFFTSQSLFKYLPQYDEIYPRIATAVNNARFVFISNPNDVLTDQFKKRLSTAFQKHGVSMEKSCVFAPRLSPDNFLRLNQVSDVLLDPISWSGGKTTLEGLACGLPVVTCPGAFMRSRHAYAMLKKMETTDTIACDINSYVDIAVRLGTDKTFYHQTRRTIESRCHILFNDAVCMQGLEAFYRNVVEGKNRNGE